MNGRADFRESESAPASVLRGVAGGFWWRLIFLGLLVAGPGVGEVSAKRSEVRKAKIEVNGLGWIRNRDQRLSLERLLGSQRGEVIASNAIEDGAFLLVSALEGEGFLKPAVEIALVLGDGAKQRFQFDTTLATPLPRDLSATSVAFNVKPGVRYFVNDVRISGLTAFPVETAHGYLMPGQALFATAPARAYTPGRVRRALSSVQEELVQRGYAEAQVRTSDVQIDDRSGKVSVAVEVVEGPRWEVSSLQFTGGENSGVDLGYGAEFTAVPWTPLFQQDLRERVRRSFYAHGYPEMTVRLIPKAGATVSGVKPVEVTAAITHGEKVQVGQVKFEGNERTREAVLRRRVIAKPGDPLDPIQLERSRYRLSRLGVFDSVELRYDPSDGPVRDPVFQLEEGRRREANLLLGYGSYEQVRVGAEYRQFNLWGMAHQSRAEVVQSMKSSRGEYSYTVPELFGERIDGTARVFGLQRQERAFLRQEFGVNLSLKRPLPWFKIDATTGYTYQALLSKENELGTKIEDAENITVASLDFGLTSDQRDNPLRPRHGFRWFAQLEAASRQLGGEADYQRMEAGAAFHTSWGKTRWIHLGLTHGLITTQGAENDRLLPVNKRFFPGGDSSIRGYQLGEAAPRGADGRFVGAKTYLLFNAELEQALTSTWSVVLFGDALGEAVRLSSYPADEQLYTVGLGVRYQTLIGPVRMEYGRNLNPRIDDPSGTLHFSVGFPF
ncbi:MAG TPA: BamA/TamA family outer membrane protein [Opitutaceae bacterium]|nr:BamA/TamA family outer membrane protein [Opitutaceae bacterium]